MTSGSAQLMVSLASGGSEVETRWARPAQRGLAAQAMCALDASAAEASDRRRLTSISHSRGVAMAAALDMPGGTFVALLGCDVEFTDTRRRWVEIGSFLTGETFAGDAAQACRAWTLAEAWFKAFQVWPAHSLVRRALYGAGGQAPGNMRTLASSVHWYAFEPVPGFQASMVWRGPALTPVVTGVASDDGDATSGSAP